MFIVVKGTDGREMPITQRTSGLVRRQVALILTMPTAAALAAKTATSPFPLFSS